MTIRGPLAEIRWGYVTAGTLADWTFDGTSSGGAITGRLAVADAFALTQSDLCVVVQAAGREWRWPVRSAVSPALHSRLEVGPQEIA